MRLYWTLSFLLTVSMAISQTVFIGVISQDENEPNIAGQVFEYQNDLYLSGDYFDSQINRWTAYIAKLKNNGELDYLETFGFGFFFLLAAFSAANSSFAAFALASFSAFSISFSDLISEVSVKASKA